MFPHFFRLTHAQKRAAVGVCAASDQLISVLRDQLWRFFAKLANFDSPWRPIFPIWRLATWSAIFSQTLGDLRRLGQYGKMRMFLRNETSPPVMCERANILRGIPFPNNYIVWYYSHALLSRAFFCRPGRIECRRLQSYLSTVGAVSNFETKCSSSYWNPS